MSWCFVQRYESLLFLLMYGVYIVLMFFNRRLEAWIVPKFPGLGHEARPKLGDAKLQNIGSMLNYSELTANNNEITELDVDSDNTSKFTLCI